MVSLNIVFEFLALILTISGVFFKQPVSPVDGALYTYVLIIV